jgi:hypothetical protein
VPSGNADDGNEIKERLVQPVRHGYGIQLYGRNPEAGDKLCFYSGKWERDQKSGEGSVQIYPDGVSEYQGAFKSNGFHGLGKLALKCTDQAVTGKHVYTGNFKEGKL